MRILSSSGGIFDDYQVFSLDIDRIPGEIYSSLIVMLIIAVISIIIGVLARRQDPLKKPKGILHLAEIGVETFDGMVKEYMGPQFKGFGGFVMAIAMYLFLSFIFGLTGLPSPMTYIAIPLSLGLTTFVLIHATAIRFQKWGYFKRYVEPFPVMLPINLLSMWAPLISLTLRIFGNAVAGWTIMTILYYGLENVSATVFSFIESEWNQIFFAPIVTPVLHAYFDLFSGFIQTLVFISLSMIYIGQEVPQEDF